MTPLFAMSMLLMLSTAGADCQLNVPTRNHVRYDVMIPELPPTRTVLSFDAPGGQHVEVVWDPLQSNRLDRLVILEGGRDWTISLSAEPQRDANKGQFDYSWQFRPGSCEPKESGKVLRYRKLQPECLGPISNGSCVNLAVEELGISIQPAKPMTAQAAAMRLVRRDGSKDADSSIARARSFGSEPAQVVRDLGATIAEVAVERVQDRSFKLAQRRLQEFLGCSQSPQVTDASQMSASHPEQLQKSQRITSTTMTAGLALQTRETSTPDQDENHTPTQAPLTQTCALVRKMRLTDIAGSGQTLTEALSQDMLGVALGAVDPKPRTGATSAPVCGKLSWSALQPILESVLTSDLRREPDEVLARRLVGVMAQGCFEQQPQSVGCNPVQLSLAVLSECEQGLDCNTSSIQFYLDHARELFTSCSSHGVPKKIFDPVSFVAKGLEVMAPKADVSTRRQLRLSVSMLADVLKYQAWSWQEKPAQLQALMDEMAHAESRAGSLAPLLPDLKLAEEIILTGHSDSEGSFDGELRRLAEKAFRFDNPSVAEMLVSAVSGDSLDSSRTTVADARHRAKELLEKATSADVNVKSICELTKDVKEGCDHQDDGKSWLPQVKARNWEGARSAVTDPILRARIDRLEAAENFDHFATKLKDYVDSMHSSMRDNLPHRESIVAGGDPEQYLQKLAGFRKEFNKASNAAALSGALSGLPTLRESLANGDFKSVCSKVADLKNSQGTKDGVKVLEKDGVVKALDPVWNTCTDAETLQQDLQWLSTAPALLVKWEPARSAFDVGACQDFAAEMQKLASMNGLETAFKKAVQVKTWNENDAITMCSGKYPPLEKMDELARLVDALLGNDFQEALTVFFAKFQDEKEPLNAKRVKVLTALTSFVRTYGEFSAMRPEDAAQMHEARQKSVSTLIDLLGSREDRWDETIISLSANLGVAMAVDKMAGEKSALRARLNLPVGLSFDHLSRNKSPGWHASLFALDLGQYASPKLGGGAGLPQPRGDTLLALGLQMGMLFNSPEDPINLSLDIRYSPSIEAEKGWFGGTSKGDARFSFGLTLSYLVPLIDLN